VVAGRAFQRTWPSSDRTSSELPEAPDDIVYSRACVDLAQRSDDLLLGELALLGHASFSPSGIGGLTRQLVQFLADRSAAVAVLQVIEPIMHGARLLKQLHLE